MLISVNRVVEKCGKNRIMMENSTYAIVEFIKEESIIKSVELLPFSWLLGRDKCRYPPKSLYMNVEKWVKKNRNPDINWKIYPVQIISEAGK